MKKTMKSATKKERGQAIVELTLGMGVLLLIMMGLLDLGRAYYIYIALEDSAGEAAVYLSIDPLCVDSTYGTNNECDDPNNAQFRAFNAAGGDLDWTGATFSTSVPANFGTGSTVSVTIEYSFDLITPIITSIAGANSITLTSTATQTIVADY